jgi:3-dehydroquinate dehydratase/shikimate dehydrogenase
MTNRLAVSLALPDTGACLDRLADLRSSIGLAEIRLDLMKSVDLERLIRQAPCPLIITCRPPREGGRFEGSEIERLNLLARATYMGAAFVDVEWDSITMIRKILAEKHRTSTKLIASRHWLNHMPSQLFLEYDSIRRNCDVVKLVGTAKTLTDVLPVFDLLKRATTPVIGLAMGEAGQLTRLLSPCFDNCLLTYASASTDASTAPGQLTIEEMTGVYRLNRAGAHTAIHLHLCDAAESAQLITAQNLIEGPGEQIHVAVLASRAEATRLASLLPGLVPRLTLTSDFQIDCSTGYSVR